MLLKIRNHGSHVLAIDEDQIVNVKRAVTYRPNFYQAFVTVMRGCDNYCSYCIVPYVRGREISRTIADIKEEVQSLVSNGCKESDTFRAEYKFLRKGFEWKRYAGICSQN